MIQWESIIESMPFAIIAINRDRKVVAFNSNALKLFNQTRKNFLGCSCVNILDREICQHHCPISSGNQFSESKQNAILLQTGNAEDAHVLAEVRSVPWQDAEHQFLGCIHVLTMSTQRKPVQNTKEVPDLSALGLLGSSSLMQEVSYLIRAVAPTSSTVLIQGETGTGKEIAAHIIYSLSGRGKQSFVSLNCAAFPENLIESELFGHERGAFTGADKEHKGYFETAHMGTIFLDEIAETSLRFQAKLLRVLQSGEYQRLGATQPRRTDARIIAATNKDLAALVNKNQFRADLYYRLNVFPIKMPPLRNHLEDLSALVDYFIKEFSAFMNKPIEGINEVALTFLHQYDYPGNIRELKNILEYAFIKCNSRLIGPTDLPPIVIEHSMKSTQKAYDISGQNVLDVLNQCNSNKAKAARTLGISRKTLYHKLKKNKADIKDS